MQWWVAALIAIAGAGACVLFDYLALVTWPGLQRQRDEIVEQRSDEGDGDRQDPPGEPT